MSLAMANAGITLRYPWIEPTKADSEPCLSDLDALSPEFPHLQISNAPGYHAYSEAEQSGSQSGADERGRLAHA